MTRSHGKHPVPAAPPPPPPAAEANGAHFDLPTSDGSINLRRVYRLVVWLWALAFLALLSQAALDLLFGAVFGPVGR